jgi:hypothetical protein
VRRHVVLPGNFWMSAHDTHLAFLESVADNFRSAQFTPFAARTQQFVKEQLGQADEKTQLPDDYLELEKRVDALKQVHQKLLSVTYVDIYARTLCLISD